MASYRSWGLRSAGVGLVIAAAASACGGDDDDSPGGGAKAGKTGSAGSAHAGNGGRPGSGGTAGSSNSAGTSSGATAGNASGGRPASGGAGAGGLGTGGTSAAGTSNQGGDSGASGQGGEGGEVAGAAGAAGGPPECDSPSDCDDSKTCTDDACTPGGTCRHTPAEDDDDACTADACDETSGPSHTPVTIDDSNPCTTDACDPSTGVSHAPDDGETCELSGGGTGVCSTGACVPPVCGNNAVEPGEECDGGNTDDLDGCNSKCQSEVSSGPGLGLALVDDGYTGTLVSMQCVDLPVGTKGDGVVDSVKVRVAITHGFVGDLVLKVVSPSNTVVTLMSRPGVDEPTDNGISSGGDSSNLTVGFPISFVDGGPKSAETMGNTLTQSQNICEDDGACVYAPDAGAATAGLLSAFVGQTAVGTWRFCAADSLAGDLGSIDFVRLSIVQ